MSIFDIFRKNTSENITIPERHINPKYILDEKYREAYIKQGYVIIKNVISDDAIERVLRLHDEISKMPGYFESDKLQTSIAFGEKIHQKVIQEIQDISVDIFNKLLDPDLCHYDFGGGIIIKNKGCWFAPHQDCSIIDEYKGTTTYAWMPTVSMNDDNGTFYAIPGSHKWAAWQRSSQHPSWPFKKYSQLLWDNMVPLYLDKGDMLLFDSALIHASGDNKTNEKRIAFNACIIEKDAQHVQYVQDKSTPKGKIEKYFVDLDFWYKGNLWGRPQGYEKVTEDLIYPPQFTEQYLLDYIHKYKS
ncbi:MAG: phytanoyl-CoA dioxygenase family protein [Chitinophagales bacterium]